MNPTTTHSLPAYSFTPQQEKVLLFVLAAIQFTHILDFVIIMPLGPQLIRVFKITPQEFSLLVAAYTVSAGFSGLAGSFFIDRFDRRIALLVLYAGFTVGTLGCALAPDYSFFLGARIFAGLFGGVLSAMIFSVIGDVIPESRRGAATGKVMAAFSVASVVGIPFGLQLATFFSWHAPFLLLVAMSVLVLPLCYKVLPSMRSHLISGRLANPIKNMQEILSNNNLLWALFLMIMLSIAGFTVIPFISPYMVANVGLKEAHLSYIYLFGGALTFFTSPYIGRLADRFGKPRVFSWMAIFSVFPVLAITHLSVTPLWLVLVITSLFFVVNGGRFVPAMAMVTSSVEPKHRGSFMSLNSSLQSMGSGIASFLSGLIITQTPEKMLLHFNWVGYVSVAATLICVLISAKVKTALVPTPNTRETNVTLQPTRILKA